jgi:arylsulfatase A-like enzyme
MRLLSLALVLAATAAFAKPNIVLVITDDQGYGDLACHGNPVIKTPNLDKLHSESTSLTNYHVAPTCSPTRAALLTGHWTNRTGVWHTIMGRSMLRANEVTLGQHLKDAGYQTGMFGKWHLGDNYPYRPEDRGFTEVYRHGGGGVGQTPDVWDNSYFDGGYFHLYCEVRKSQAALLRLHLAECPPWSAACPAEVPRHVQRPESRHRRLLWHDHQYR